MSKNSPFSRRKKSSNKNINKIMNFLKIVYAFVIASEVAADSHSCQMGRECAAKALKKMNSQNLSKDALISIQLSVRICKVLYPCGPERKIPMWKSRMPRRRFYY